MNKTILTFTICIAIQCAQLANAEGVVTATRANATTQQLPAYYPSNFQNTGVVVSKQSSREWIISGKIYTLSNDVKIFLLNSESASHFHIRASTEVGFNVDQNNVISAIWELPRNSVSRH